MKKLFLLLFCGIFIFCCNNQQKVPNHPNDNKLVLQPNRINVVKLTDRMIIYESTCRGCEYERSTSFEMNDSLNIVALQQIVTTDNSPGDMDGGYISKDLIIKPIKTGVTTIRLYKIWSPKTARHDSTRYTSYTIDVRN